MKKKLLIVDDEPSIGLIIEHYFSKDYQVIVKYNGQEAIDWLQEGNYVDCIVADYEMPFMNGFEFIRHLQASMLFRDIPIVMLSGKDETKDKILCLREGAADYMIKPFNPEELEIRIKNMLRRIKV